MPDTRYPYQNPELTIEQRTGDLLQRMTLEEKAGQLNQLYIRSDDPAHCEEIKALIRKGGLGSRILSSTLHAGNVSERAANIEDLNDVQRVAVEESRLGIPLIHGRDVIHGHRTVFPIPLALAATFDPDLVEQAFAVAAREAASAGVHWSFAPMLDIARDPRWGRVIEGTGEDPYLGEQMGKAMVRGFQGDGLSPRPAQQAPARPDREKILACAKHYIGYGAAEGGRDYDSAEISDNTLRNIYLPPFRAAVEAGVGSVMSAFHDLNGEPASGSRYLLSELLKGELGFGGFIVSDWTSVEEMIEHRIAADRRDAARIAFDAGVDMDMCAYCFGDHLVELVRSGELSEEQLNDAVRRVLEAKFRLGLFEHPYTDAGLDEKVQFTAENQALARRAAARSLVLLQNKGDLLPLPQDLGRIAVIGPLADQRRALLGSWMLDGMTDETQNLVEAVRAARPQAQILTISGSLSDEMLLQAARADVVILAVGESNIRNGENNCTSTLELPPGQEELIEAVAAIGKPIVLVVLAGRPVLLGRITRFVEAILYAWHPGSLGAAAISDVLFGQVVPSGKLPISFPRSDGHIPAHYNRKSTGRPRMLRYLDAPITALYPFGFGLSYTRFAYRDLTVDSSETPAGRILAGESVNVSVTVTNIGDRLGEEVVQCYVQDCLASTTRPVRELKGFARVTLQPGESKTVHLTLGAKELSFYGKDGKLCLEAGKFKVWAGGDSQAELEASFRVL